MVRACCRDGAATAQLQLVVVPTDEVRGVQSRSCRVHGHLSQSANRGLGFTLRLTLSLRPQGRTPASKVLEHMLQPVLGTPAPHGLWPEMLAMNPAPRHPSPRYEPWARLTTGSAGQQFASHAMWRRRLVAWRQCCANRREAELCMQATLRPTRQSRDVTAAALETADYSVRLRPSVCSPARELRVQCHHPTQIATSHLPLRRSCKAC